MGIALLDAWRVFWLEARRYRRWRPLRRWLVGAALLSVLWSLATLGLWAFSEQIADARARLNLQRFLFACGYALPTAVGLIAALSLTPRLIGDRTRRGVLTDIYLTELHPLGVVLGRLGAVAWLSGVLILTASPPSVLAAAAADVAGLQWLQGLLTGWLALLLLIALVARLQWRTVPELDALRRRAFIATPLSATLLALAALLVYGYLYSAAQPPLGVALLMLSSLLLPFGAAIYAGSVWTIGGLSLPVAPIASAIALASALTLATATAQWLSWWSARGYRLQRALGGLTFLGLIALGAAFWAEAGFAPSRVYFYGLQIAGVLGYYLARFALGFYGVGRRLCPRDGFGGVWREWLLLGLSAVAVYSAVGVSRGVWLEPLWAIAVAFYFWGMLVWAQSLSLSVVLYRRDLLHAEAPPSLREQIVSEACPVDRSETSRLISLLFTIYILSWGLSHPVLTLVLYYPLLITPLGGLLRTDFAPWAYALYGLYALGVAAIVARLKLQPKTEVSEGSL